MLAQRDLGLSFRGLISVISLVVFLDLVCLSVPVDVTVEALFVRRELHEGLTSLPAQGLEASVEWPLFFCLPGLLAIGGPTGERPDVTHGRT